jgi:hypothetical protein
MKRINLTLAVVWLAAAGSVVAEPAQPTRPPEADPVAEALPILQAKYAGFSELHYQAGDRLSDLAARSDGKISLVTPDLGGPRPILVTLLPDDIVYLRAGSFSPRKDWTQFAADLKALLDGKSPEGAVVDLRANSSADYSGAAQFLGLFAPGDTALLKYVAAPAPAPAPLHFHAPIVVLTNNLTAAAAEALAGCLKSDGALVVGRTTAGSGFEEDKLSSGLVLRFAVPLASAPGDTMMRPVVPDLALAVDDHNEKAALTLIRDEHVLDVIEESAPRARMSEASLVHGQDPEWDAYLASLEKGPVLLSLPRIHDPVLITALDSLRAIRLSQTPPPADATANNAPAVAAPME